MPEDRNEWARRILDVPANFFGEIRVEYRNGKPHKVSRVETFISPDRDQSYRKSLEGAKPVIRAHDAK